MRPLAAALAALFARDEVRAAIASAAAAGFAVRCDDLGAWGARVRPCAELDRRAGTMALDRRVLVRALERLGESAAAELACAAIAHELAHVARPVASEAEIRQQLRARALARGERDPDALVRAASAAP